MKKITCALLSIFTAFILAAQTKATVDLRDQIYQALEYAELRGLCTELSGVKPYTQERIMRAVDEILLNAEKLSGTELLFLREYQEKHFHAPGFTKRLLGLRYAVPNKRVPLSIQVDFAQELSFSGGLYTDKRFNQWGMDWLTTLDFGGDIGHTVSYRMDARFNVSRMPLSEAGSDYFIGYRWYDKGVSEFLDGKELAPGIRYPEPPRRTVKKFFNTSYLPYAYKRRWGGQMYLFENLTASGLEGWPQTAGMSGNLLADIGASFFDGKLSVLLSRMDREWAAMERGASLVYNANAAAFAAFDIRAELFSFLKFSGLTGVLEYPNQEYIAEKSWPERRVGVDAYFFQNGFSINMVELDFKYLHFDFGTSVIWPNRFALGYMIPLINFVEYQNHIGDYDNLALFANIKLRKPGLGAIWASAYLDEINGLNNNPITATRAMYAGQLGAKAVIPQLPFATLSLRYTKVEPYCYTHHSINYTPWYSHYISTAYVNGGSSLGYYLDPNSDETVVRFEFRPLHNLLSSLQYQFIRHGADYGSQQVPGSSPYSELSTDNRNKLKKFFLHDGAYNWMHIVSAGISVDAQWRGNPINVFANAGFLYSSYTVIDSDIYNERKKYGNNGNSGADQNTPFTFIDTDEYPVQCGGVLTLGVKLWKR